MSGTAWVRSIADLVAVFKDRARRFAYRLETKFSASMAAGASFDEATNANAILSYKAAQCHAAYVMVRNNAEALSNYVKDAKILAALERLLHLQLLVQMHENMADWIGLVDASHVEAVADEINAVLDSIRPDCVGLTDAFMYTDHTLGSVLGRYDGNVYQAIYEDARRNPLNASTKMVGWDLLKTILDMDFIKNGVRQRASL